MKTFIKIFPWISFPLSLIFTGLFVNGNDFAFIPMVLIAICSVYFVIRWQKYYSVGGDDDE